MPGAFYSAETPETTWEFLRERLIPAFFDHAELEPRRLSEWLEEFDGEPFAKAGLEGAVWDLHANTVGKPLWDLLGGSKRPIASGAAIGLLPTLRDLLDRVRRFLEQGYQRIKIKIEPGRDVELVRAIRQRFGSIPLMVDANASYKMEHVSIFDELDPLGLMMIEQPLAGDALAEHAALRQRLRTPICLDESANSLDRIRTIIRLRSAGIINIKVQRMGGLWSARQAHDLAQFAGIPCWLGTMPEMGIASAQGLHLGTLPGFTYPSDVEASTRWFSDDLVSPLIEVSRAGFINLPDGPGMGYEVNLERVAQYRIGLEEFKP